MHGQGTHGQTKQTALHYYELDAIHNVMDLHVLQLRRLSAGGLSRIEGLKVETPLPSNGLEELVNTLSIGVPAIASISQRMAKI